MREAVSTKRMPPWFADPAYGRFANDTSLKPQEIRTLEEWIENGMPEGDPRDAPPSKEWPNDWRIGRPDLVVEIPAVQRIPASGTLDYRILKSPMPWKRDAYITAIEIIPGDRRVVHHIEIYIDGMDAENEIYSYAPGSPPLILPDDTACHFPTGHSLSWLLHYTPNGKETTDRTKVGFKFWKGADPPKYIRRITSVTTRDEINIAPGAKDYIARNDWVMDGRRELFAMRPHMHLRGCAFECDALYPDGRRERILSVPHYDFNWQMDYVFEQPLTFPEGTKLHFTSHYDNSSDNPNNPDPTMRVRSGVQTNDEMQTVLLDMRCRTEDEEEIYRRSYEKLLAMDVATRRASEKPDHWWHHHTADEFWYVSLLAPLPLGGLVLLLRRRGRERNARTKRP
jgi:hypothetical protein